MQNCFFATTCQPFAFLCALILAFSQAANAEQAPSEDSAKSTVQSKEDEKKKSVLLLSLKRSGSIDESTGKLLDELLAVELGKYRSQLKTLSDADVKRLLELDAAKMVAGCDDESCMTEIAQALGARYVISGRIGDIESQKIMTLNLYDAEENEYLHRLQSQDNSLEGLMSRMSDSVAEVIAPLLAGKNSPASTQSSPSPVLWNASAIVAGVVIAGGGIAFDVLSPTSSDDKVNGFDFIGPVIYLGIAPLVAVGGILLNPFGAE